MPIVMFLRARMLPAMGNVCLWYHTRQLTGGCVVSEPFLCSLFSPEGKVTVVTGGSGMLGAPMAKGLVQASARVAILAFSHGECETRRCQKICEHPPSSLL
jgi:hypothetical protein